MISFTTCLYNLGTSLVKMYAALVCYSRNEPVNTSTNIQLVEVSYELSGFKPTYDCVSSTVLIF